MLRKLFVALALIAAVAYFLTMSDDTAVNGLTLFDPRDSQTVEAAGDESPTSTPIAPIESAEPALPVVPQNMHLLGNVTRVDGTPVAGLHIEHRHPYLKTSAAISSADGTFGIDVEEPRGELVLTDEGWLLLGGERFPMPTRTDGYSLVVAPATSLSGRVVDAKGAAVQGATVRAFAPIDALTPLGIVATPLEDPRQSAFTDAQGNFRLAAVPEIPGVLVSVTLTGYATLLQSLASPPSDALQLVLRAP